MRHEINVKTGRTEGVNAHHVTPQFFNTPQKQAQTPDRKRRVLREKPS